MELNTHTIILALGLLIPLLLHMRRSNPAWMFAAAGVLFVGMAGAQAVLFAFAPEWAATFTQTSTIDGATYDTYYIVAHQRFVLLFGVGALLISGLIGIQHALNALQHPALTRWLFWPAIAALYSSVGFAAYVQGQVPRRYVDASSFQTANHVQSAAILATSLAVCFLVLLFIKGFFGRKPDAPQT